MQHRLGSFVGVRVRGASAVGLARLGLGQGGPMLAHQGHLWGEDSAAGGRRLEDASDARPASKH